jgi:hypothetical protein
MHVLHHVANVTKAYLIQFHEGWLLKYYPIKKKYFIWIASHLKYKHIAVVLVKFSI